jgi:hypothetical protein
VIIGIFFSGPIGFIIVQLSRPQPPWVSAEIFAENYSSIQVMPYVFGFLLILGFLLFFASLVNSGKEQHKPLEMMGMTLGAVFASLISFNYIIQIAYVPNALDQNGVILSFVSMANPKSIAWALEMFGYAILGLATIAAAPLFYGKRLQRIIRWLLVFNGVASIGGAAAVSVDLSGVLSPTGFVGYVIWNILIIVIMVLVIVEFRFGKTSKNE